MPVEKWFPTDELHPGYHSFSFLLKRVNEYKFNVEPVIENGFYRVF